MISCVETEIELTEVISANNIFAVKESNVVNGQSIHFRLPSKGTYTLSLIDVASNQVISRERFVGQEGENVKKIYTKSLQSRYLYLLLEDVTKTELGKTTIIIK
jgi:hypothetical protein